MGNYHYTNRYACKQEEEEVVEEITTGAICHERAEKAREAGDLRGALVWALKGIDDHVSKRCHGLLCSLDRDGLRLSPEERRVLTKSTEASDVFLSGVCIHTGLYGFSEDEAAGYRRFCVAAEKHHAYAIYWKAACLRYGHGVPQDRATALRCLERAAQLGHACCKHREVDEEKMTGTICHERAAAAHQAGELREALAWALRGIAEYMSQQCNDILQVLHYGGLRLSEEECRALTVSDDASDTYFSGYGLRHGIFGFTLDKTASYSRICTAAAQSHAYAIVLKGHTLRYGYGVVVDKGAALQCYEDAARLGCGAACWDGARMLYDDTSFDMGRHLSTLYCKRGAALGNADCAEWLQWVTQEFPTDAAPWSMWRPDTDVHSLQLEDIHRSQMTMLLVAKRLQMAKGVALMVLRFISTDAH